MASSLLLLGATGAVGSVFLPRARAAGLEVIPHVRPATAQRHALGKDPQALICDLSDATALDAAMARCDRVVILVGTTRRRFRTGDTYESSDLLPVELAVASAKRVPAQSPRLIVLLSSFGARKGGGYLGFKWRAEDAVRSSGLPWIILRSSIFDDRGSGAQASDGRARRPPPGLGPLLRALGSLPGLRGLTDDARPIRLEVLAAALVKLSLERAPLGRVLEGRELWPLGST